MATIRLARKSVPKIWGRRDVPSVFGADPAEPIGEIWFEAPAGSAAELMVKYLFTSERLSIQVHPDDAAARRAGFPRGKDEAWVILRAEPGAEIGLGLRHAVTRDALRAAALDGSIEQLVDWRPVRAGDVIYSKAGTIHALGPGLVLIEIQQNVDLTYRLYDYGRPRELHVDAAVAAATPAPFHGEAAVQERGGGRQVLSEGGAFVLERWRGDLIGRLMPEPGRPCWIVPVAGSISLDGERFGAGEVCLADAGAKVLQADGAESLVAYPGAFALDVLIR